MLQVLIQQRMEKNATESESCDIPHVRPDLVVSCGDVVSERKDSANGNSVDCEEDTNCVVTDRLLRL